MKEKNCLYIKGKMLYAISADVILHKIENKINLEEKDKEAIEILLKDYLKRL